MFVLVIGVPCCEFLFLTVQHPDSTLIFFLGFMLKSLADSSQVDVPLALLSDFISKGPNLKKNSRAKIPPAIKTTMERAMIQPIILLRRCFLRFRCSQESLHHLSQYNKSSRYRFWLVRRTRFSLEIWKPRKMLKYYLKHFLSPPPCAQPLKSVSRTQDRVRRP